MKNFYPEHDRNVSAGCDKVSDLFLETYTHSHFVLWLTITVIYVYKNFHFLKSYPPLLV